MATKWYIGLRTWNQRVGDRSACFSRRPLHMLCCLNKYENGINNLAHGYYPNDKLFGYTVDRVTQVSDFNLAAIQLHHDKTGAQHLHICQNDSNNCFSVGFPTNPKDSTGVAHILEHTALCGSRRFPVRDPFFKMLTRSLATFMNAFTASDWTMYPFSTQNDKDFHNLLSVYLDSVFHPQLRLVDFRQEGWRLEHKEPYDQSSPIEFKGIVFNEMKGVFSSPDNIFAQAMQNHLFPSNTYSHVSGGLPINILDLKVDQLREFHKHHYNPTNGYFYTYGDMPLATHLQRIDEEFLCNFERVSQTECVAKEPKWDKPREHHIHCGVDPMIPDMNKHTTVSLSFLLTPITDAYESLVLSVISQLLVDGPASPFYQALLDSKIGSDYSPMTGYDNSTYEASFSVGLREIAKDDVSKVKDIIWKTFESVASNGFEEERVQAIVHQVELAMKHQSSNFGLHLISSLFPIWIHGGDPVNAMQVNKLLQKFKSDLSSGDFLQKKVREYFLENNHHLTLIMTPNEDYETNLQRLEQEKLNRFISNLSDSDKSTLYDDGIHLLKDQNSDAYDPECLPTLTVSDVEKYPNLTELETLQAGCTPIQYSIQPTNGVVYFKALSNIKSLQEELKIFVPLFCYVITKMGAGDMDHRQFAQLCDLWCSGFSASPHLSVYHSSSAVVNQDIFFSSYCVDRHLQHMLSLWQDVFVRPNLTNLDRLRTLVDMIASNLATSIADSGHVLAMLASASNLTPAARYAELFNGMTQIEYLRKLAGEADLTDAANSLASIAANMSNSNQMKFAVNCENGTACVHDKMQTLVESLSSNGTSSSKVEEFSPVFLNVYHEMPFSVNFVAQSYVTVPYADVDSPRLQVLAKLLGSKFLHREIREKGGAYGSGVRQGNGILSFFSYRDPCSTETLQVFQESIEWACSGRFSEKDVDEAKLSVFSQIDAPLSPGARGSDTFLNGITDDLKKQYRNYLFDVNKDQVKAAAERYLNCELKSSAIIGPKNSSSKLDANWIVN